MARDEVAEVRLALVDVMSRVCGPDARSFLAEALRDDEDWVRIRAMEALGCGRYGDGFSTGNRACGSVDEDLMEQVADAVSTEGRAKFNMQQKYGDVGRYKGCLLGA